MTRKRSHDPKEHEESLQAAMLLKPLIEQGVAKLTPESREALRRSVLAIEKFLSDTALPVAERFERLRGEFAVNSKLGPVWRLVANHIDSYARGLQPGGDGSRELGAVSLILGLLLDALPLSRDRAA